MTNAEQEILRQKLQKFKDDNNINDYDLGLEIGLSSDTILNFRKGRDILPRSLDKIAEFFKTYVTPEQKISNLQRENAELKAENDRLKEEIKQLEDFVKSDGEIDHINHEYTYKLKQTLQEIKAIAEADSPFIDNFEIKSAIEVGYDYAAICNELELRLHKVLELITKAEGE